MFQDKSGDNTVTNDEVIQRYYYYPFGAETKNAPWTQQPTPTIRYQYNGKEKIDELGLAWNDYGARNYDALLGRWMGVDALAEKYVGYSGYNYVMGNPISLIDPDGMSVEPINIYNRDKNGNYINQQMVNAFEGYAKSEEGIKFLSDFARKGQTIAGHLYEEDGIYHSAKIDLEIKGVNSGEIKGNSGTTSNRTKNNRTILTCNIDQNQHREDHTLGTIIHETIVHARYFALDLKSDGKKDYSNLDPYVLSNCKKCAKTGSADCAESEWHHINMNSIKSDNILYHTIGRSIFKDYYNSKKIKQSGEEINRILDDGGVKTFSPN